MSGLGMQQVNNTFGSAFKNQQLYALGSVQFSIPLMDHGAAKKRHEKATAWADRQELASQEVERLLRPHLSAPYIITKCPDTKFGEIVVLLTEGTVDEARTVCETVLSGYLRPRGYIHVDKIPLTETGKPARQRILEIARYSILQ